MIVVRTHGSRLLEKAYFIVRNGKNVPTVCKEDMLWEANRIIETSLSAASLPSGTRETETAA